MAQISENPKSGKKVVRVQPTTSSTTSAEGESPASTWKPTPEAKQKAIMFRVIAAVLWALAIGAEIFTIFWVLRQDPINTVLLIILLVVIGGLAVGGSLLWKRSNLLDPASKSQPVRFFVQNQLGAIITVIAFLPLIVLIFTNKNMDGKQKGIAGGVAIAVLLVAGFLGTSLNPPSTEQYDDQTSTVVGYTGQDLVFWTKSGKVYHLCAEASAVNLESKDNQIYSGTVADARAAGKSRLTLEVESELKQCGFDATPAPVVDQPEPAPTPTP